MFLIRLAVGGVTIQRIGNPTVGPDGIDFQNEIVGIILLIIKTLGLKFLITGGKSISPEIKKIRKLARVKDRPLTPGLNPLVEKIVVPECGHGREDSLFGSNLLPSHSGEFKRFCVGNINITDSGAGASVALGGAAVAGGRAGFLDALGGRVDDGGAFAQAACAHGAI